MQEWKNNDNESARVPGSVAREKTINSQKCFNYSPLVDAKMVTGINQRNIIFQLCRIECGGGVHKHIKIAVFHLAYKYDDTQKHLNYVWERGRHS